MANHQIDKKPVVLITGASGLIGTRVARELSPDYVVVGLDVVDPPPDFPDEAQFAACDLTSQSKTGEALKGVIDRVGAQIASVLHLAAYYDFSGESSPLYEELTVRGTQRLLRALNEHAAVEQFVFSSSLLVMKPSADGPLDESSPTQAEWDYPQSKLDAEEVIRRERGDISAVILRLAGAYDEGGHSPPITQQIWRIREKKLESFVFPGNRSHGQSFIHLDDVAKCFRSVVDRRRELDAYEVFLIGEPETLSYGALQDQIGELLHDREWPTLRIPAPVAKAGAWVKEKTGGEQFIKPWMVDLADAHYPVSMDHARERLAFEPVHRLDRELPKMIEALQRDPRAWYRENGLPVDDDG